MAARVVVERVEPQVDGGRFPIKRTPGETVVVTTDVFADGQDQVAGVLRYRVVRGPGPAHRKDAADSAHWTEVPLTPLGNDAWRASFEVTELGEYEYTVEAWLDRFGTWLEALTKKADAGQDVASELLEGAELVQRAALSDDDMRLLEIADVLRSAAPQAARVTTARDPQLRALMEARPDRTASTMAAPLRVVVDRERARFGAWYEMFPRSCTTDASRPGTLHDAEARLPAIAGLGFDVVYLPPVHPVGRTYRKGRNNALTVEPGDPGSPWAIGSEAGGHTAVDPGLGTIEDFDRFVAAARHLGLEIALDIAFQASPDHPWVKEHPEWFRHRPDGSIKHAENPPKKYQDIYPFDFDSSEWRSLWEALRDVFLFWTTHGVTIFRVDNPHTKPFGFWEWVIAEVRRRCPEAIFLSEAFTRPKVMRYLTKAGFSQSYTYFTWRTSAHELREYLTELTQTELQQYMRPNFFANTPDILHEYLQHGGRPAFEVRLVLAATLSASYGIYSGFELCENVPVRPGSEEYLNSEKYEIRVRDWNQPGNLNELIARVNQIRREHPALQGNETLRFHAADNPMFLWFSKSPPGLRPLDRAGHEPRPTYDRWVFVVANTDPHWTQHGHVQVPIWELGLAPDQPYLVEDLLDGAQYAWRGEWNYVKLDPRERIAHILVVRSITNH
ncbi:MAG: alpha-1,4-glucan--maltose-1-phosphate maltosyltransferase [Acidobacteria bacterium]|nr:alpha-1,4-glucan--maltose-1-phosphate maltosyltransferase [Acidobacteriota bacterium]